MLCTHMQRVAAFPTCRTTLQNYLLQRLTCMQNKRRSCRLRVCKKQECVPGCIQKEHIWLYESSSFEQTQSNDLMNVSLHSFFFLKSVSEELLQDFRRFTPATGLLATNISCNLSPSPDTPVCLFGKAKTRGPSKTCHVHHIPGGFPCSVCGAATWTAEVITEETAV